MSQRIQELQKASLAVLEANFRYDLLKNIFDDLGISLMPPAASQHLQQRQPVAPATGAPAQAVASAPATAQRGSAMAAGQAAHVPLGMAQGGQMFHAAGAWKMGTGASGKHGYPIGTMRNWHGERMVKTQASPSLWVPVDQSDKPVQDHPGHRIDPHTEHFHYLAHQMALDAGLPEGTNVDPWIPYLFTQGGKNEIKEGTAGEHATIERTEKKYKKKEAWLNPRQIITVLTGDRKQQQVLHEATMKGYARGWTLDGKFVLLPPGRGGKTYGTATDPSVNIARSMRTYVSTVEAAPNSGEYKARFCMVFMLDGMREGEQMAVGENIDERKAVIAKEMNEVQAGKHDQRLLAKVLGHETGSIDAFLKRFPQLAGFSQQPYEQRNTWLYQKGGLDVKQVEAYANLKAQELDHYDSSLKLLGMIGNKFSDQQGNFHIPPTAHMMENEVNQFGRATELTSSSELYTEARKKGGKTLHGKALEAASQLLRQSGQSPAFLHVAKKSEKDKLQYLEYEAAALANRMIANMRGQYPQKKAGDKMMTMFGKMRDIMMSHGGQSLRKEADIWGDAKIQYLNGEGRGKDRTGFDLQNAINTVSQAGTARVIYSDDQQYNNVIKPYGGEEREEIGAFGMNEGIGAPAYEKGDFGRSETAAWQVSRALTDLSREISNAANMKRATESGLQGKEAERAAGKNTKHIKFHDNFIETVARDLGDGTFAVIQPNITSKRVGNGRGFFAGDSQMAMGKHIANDEHMMNIAMHDLVFRTQNRDSSTMSYDMEGNVIASGNHGGFNPLAPTSMLIDSVKALANKEVSPLAVQTFKRVRPKDLQRLGVGTSVYGGADSASRQHITPEQLEMTAAMYNRLGSYLEQNKTPEGKYLMPNERELMTMDRNRPDMQHEPMSNFEQHILGGAMSLIAKGESDYYKKLRATAQGEYKRYKNGDKGVLMPAPYFELMTGGGQ